jgi:phage shock protein PspC (stress-responsive transcriptional regulator)
MTAPQTPRLVRPKEGLMIAGVAAGLADRFGMERSIMRLIFVLSLILPGPQILIYIVLWVIIPEDG